MNRVVLVGRITRDPELRTSNSGVPFVNFSIAINRPPLKDRDKEVDFINCVAFYKQAENLSRYIKKGNMIGVDGKIQTRSYTAQDGSKRIATDIVCDYIEFLESRPTERTDSFYDYNRVNEPIYGEKPRSAPSKAPTPDDDRFKSPEVEAEDDSNADDFGINDDDLPF